MTYTPTELIHSPPNKFTRPSFVNTPRLKSFSAHVSAYNINRQMANMGGVVAVSGFGLNLSGMCVEVLRGVCLLSQGEKVISYQTHPNKF